MNKTYICGIDLGTSSLKAVLYDQNMQQMCSVRCEYISHNKEVVTAEHWWQAFINSLSQLKKFTDLKHIACISFSGYNAFTGVDKNLSPSTPIMLYYNTEPGSYMHRLFTDQEQDYVFHRSCTNMFGSGIMAPGIRWLRDFFPKAYISTDCFLFSNGFIAARLTGNYTIDASRASLSALHDPRGAELIWDQELCNFFGIDAAKLPRIINCWEASGCISSEASLLTGLPAGIPVVIGSMDSLCAALGNGIFNNKQMLDIGGSAGGLACVSDSPKAHKRLYLSRYVLPDHWCNNAPLMSSARLFDWFIEKLAPSWTMDDYMKSVDTASRFCGGLLFLPYVGGSRYPYWAMKANGHFLNFSPDTSIQDMARSVVEGLSCAYRSILEDLTALGLPSPNYIVGAGGDTRFHTWVQSKADYLRIPYRLTDTPEVSAKGAALLGAFHIGCIPDLISWLETHMGSYTIVSPEEPADIFQQHYKRFQQSCSILYKDID